MLWITVRFRDVRIGCAALIALLHDVLVVLGAFAILGTFFGVEVDALFVTAMLTIIGFSVHDTIVVFDRVRENRPATPASRSTTSSTTASCRRFGRSINTSLTVVLTLIALFLIGGEAIQRFVLALLIGIVSGRTRRSSTRAPILVDWHLWEDRRHGRVAATRAPRARVGLLTSGRQPADKGAVKSAPWHPDHRSSTRASAGRRRPVACRRDAGVGRPGPGVCRPVAGLLARRGVHARVELAAWFDDPLAGLHDPALLPDADRLLRAADPGAGRATSGSWCSVTSTRTG